MSREGYHYTIETGLQTGLPCEGVIKPPVFLSNDQRKYDVVIIGGGYAGLTAARDLATAGLEVLLVEGRDRIGGRTWTSIIEGYAYDMGGTWVHWNQPHLYREIARYGMQDQLKSSFSNSYGCNYFNATIDGKTQKFSHQQEYEMYDKVYEMFFNVDGEGGRQVIPFPHMPHYRTDLAAKYDKLSVQDRIMQIQDKLSPLEQGCLESLALHYTGGKKENMGFFDLLRWWALCGYNYKNYVDYCVNFKFKRGKTSFALQFFQEALETGHLSYHFDWKVESVRDLGCYTEIESTAGDIFQAKRVISAVPLNLLKEIHFDPPLHASKLEASKIGHIDHASKVHVEAAGRDLGTLTAVVYPGNPLIYGWGNGETPAGNSNVVMFGSHETYFDPESDINRTIAAAKAFHEMDIRRLVFTNWSRDELAKGAWCMFSPGFATKYLDILRERQGNILFANSDWALGWRGFVDGAIEEGTRAALWVRKELASPAKGLPNGF